MVTFYISHFHWYFSCCFDGLVRSETFVNISLVRRAVKHFNSISNACSNNRASASGLAMYDNTVMAFNRVRILPDGVPF